MERLRDRDHVYVTKRFRLIFFGEQFERSVFHLKHFHVDGKETFIGFSITELGERKAQQPPFVPPSHDSS